MLALGAALSVFAALAAAALFLSRALPSRRSQEARLLELRRDLPPMSSETGPLRGGRQNNRHARLGSRWTERTARDLRQANIGLRPGEYLALRVVIALLCFVAPALLTGGHPVGLAGAFAAGLAGYLLPARYVASARRRRIARIETQLIDFLPSLAGALRSGFAFQQGVDAAAQQIGRPLADELALFSSDLKLGAGMDAALLDLAQRTGSGELDMVITAVLIQRSTGGALAEILDHAAETLRERDRLLGDVRTFTAQQRLTGLILSVYPVAVGLLLLAIMPALWSKLFTEPVGQAQLAVAVALQALGFFAIRRALDVEV